MGHVLTFSLSSDTEFVFESLNAASEFSRGGVTVVCEPVSFGEGEYVEDIFEARFGSHGSYAFGVSGG